MSEGSPRPEHGHLPQRLARLSCRNQRQRRQQPLRWSRLATKPTRLPCVLDQLAKGPAGDRKTRQPSRVLTLSLLVRESRLDRRRRLLESESWLQKRQTYVAACSQTPRSFDWGRRIPRKPCLGLRRLRPLLPVGAGLDRQ